MWYHLKCLPTLLLDGAKRYSAAAISCVKRAYAATSEFLVLLLFVLGILIALMWWASIFLLPLLGAYTLWRNV